MPPRPNIVLALSESARATMISAARRAHPNETGGILIGVDLDDGHPWVTAAIEIASDDRGRRHYRIPGGSTQPAVRAARLAYQRLGYLGDWHTHPGNSGPSPTDLATLARHSLTHLVDLMATDITNRLVDAGRLRAAWSPDRARSLASSVARAIPDAWVDWDEESGEEWARVLVDQFVVALIRVKIPLVIVVRGELTPVRQIEHDAVMIVVDDMDSPLLSATSESIGHAFQEREVSPTLDPTVFSAMDLWFATT